MIQRTKDSLLSVTAAMLLGIAGCSSSGTTNNSSDENSISSGGKVIDGIISGATVCIDTDGDGSCQNEEHNCISNTLLNGDFNITGCTVDGHLISYGGNDTGTGLPFLGKLSAPANAGVITPLTSLIESLVKNGDNNVSEAEKKVKKSLGIDNSVDLLTFNPFDTNDTVNQKVVLAQTAKIQVIAQTIATTVSSLDQNKTVANTMSTVFTALANSINKDSNISDSAILEKITNNVAETTYIEDTKKINSITNISGKLAKQTVSNVKAIQKAITDSNETGETAFNSSIYLLNTNLNKMSESNISDTNLTATPFKKLISQQEINSNDIANVKNIITTQAQIHQATIDNKPTQKLINELNNAKKKNADNALAEANQKVELAKAKKATAVEAVAIAKEKSSEATANYQRALTAATNAQNAADASQVKEALAASQEAKDAAKKAADDAEVAATAAETAAKAKIAAEAEAAKEKAKATTALESVKVAQKAKIAAEENLAKLQAQLDANTEALKSAKTAKEAAEAAASAAQAAQKAAVQEAKDNAVAAAETAATEAQNAKDAAVAAQKAADTKEAADAAANASDAAQKAQDAAVAAQKAADEQAAAEAAEKAATEATAAQKAAVQEAKDNAAAAAETAATEAQNAKDAAVAAQKAADTKEAAEAAANAAVAAQKAQDAAVAAQKAEDEQIAAEVAKAAAIKATEAQVAAVQEAVEKATQEQATIEAELSAALNEAQIATAEAEAKAKAATVAQKAAEDALATYKSNSEESLLLANKLQVAKQAAQDAQIQAQESLEKAQNAQDIADKALETASNLEEAKATAEAAQTAAQQAETNLDNANVLLNDAKANVKQYTDNIQTIYEEARQKSKEASMQAQEAYQTAQDAVVVSNSIAYSKDLLADLRTQSTSLKDFRKNVKNRYHDTEAKNIKNALDDTVSNITFVTKTVEKLWHTTKEAIDNNETVITRNISSTRVITINKEDHNDWSYIIEENASDKTWEGSIYLYKYSDKYSGSFESDFSGELPLSENPITDKTKNDLQHIDGDISLYKETNNVASVYLDLNISSNGTMIDVTNLQADVKYTTKTNLDAIFIHQLTLDAHVANYNLTGTLNINGYVRNSTIGHTKYVDGTNNITDSIYRIKYDYLNDEGYYDDGYYENGYYDDGYYDDGYYENGYYDDGYYENGYRMPWGDRYYLKLDFINSIDLNIVDSTPKYLTLFTFSGTKPWSQEVNGTNIWTSSISDAGRDGDNIYNNQDSCIETTIDKGGLLEYTSKVSSEYNFDYLRFFVDNQELSAISGEREWQTDGYLLPSGEHNLKWCYTKDESVSEGEDKAWISNVKFTPSNGNENGNSDEEITNSGYIPNDITFRGTLLNRDTNASLEDSTVSVRWFNAASINLKDMGEKFYNIDIDAMLIRPEFPETHFLVNYTKNKNNYLIDATYDYENTHLDIESVFDKTKENGHMNVTSDNGIEADITIRNKKIVYGTSTMSAYGLHMGTFEDRKGTAVVKFVDGSFESLP